MIANRANTPALFPRIFPLLVVVGVLVFVFTVYTNSGSSKYLDRVSSRLKYPINGTGFSKQLIDYDLHDYNVKTYKGYVNMYELNEKVFKLYGYEIEKPTLPVPTLRMINEPTCELVFSEWLRVSQEPQPKNPPKYIPSGESDAFLLFGYAAVESWYMNDKNSYFGEKPKNWDKLSEMITWPKEKLAEIAYVTESVSVYNAMASHRLDGMSGVVIGSAEKILTVEYNRLTIQEEFRDRMSSILPVDFVQNWHTYADKFDFAASFSSIEHSGLGRYGDPMDPIGDLREMLKIKCILKKGGLLFLGFPLGTDAIQYNVHRIYGPIRLAMMFYGFEWLSTFSGGLENAFDLNSQRLHSNVKFGMHQYTMVLKKL
ncbi:hypothetical protein GCK72_017953 [Caenorhabditis remanei]|uniref:Uncharacterized protein n=1 Tax=Caenorhabditis remanei TaxID=31234 RepID=A0A6A5GAA2_CAERE|nr:hypothetical protein GCK72_017953 [Caenorhabditis remanei]KAF1751399.1 hypothetical protein GCK72_017953 [Caenorhabditis remanei]